VSATGTGTIRGRFGHALAALATALLIAGCAPTPAATGPGGSSGAHSGAPSGSGAPQASPPPPTALELALDGIHDDGEFSKDTALAVFVASFGQLPGVTAPTSTEDVDSGTLAIQMVKTYWADLTDAQRAAIRDCIGTDAPDVLPAAFHASAVTTIDQALVDQAEADIAAHVGHRLGIPIFTAVPPATQLTKAQRKALAWTSVRYDATGQNALACLIWVRPDVASGPTIELRFTMLHEIWHCFEGMLVDGPTNGSIRPWLSEGEAEWVAESITNGRGATAGLIGWWVRYIERPNKSLLERSYDALGFFAQLDYAGKDAWHLIEPMYAAAGSYAALAVANYVDPTFRGGWASSFYRDGQPSGQWAMTSKDGIVPIEYGLALPKELSLADDEDQTLDASFLGAAIADLHTTAFVTEVNSIGVVRIGDKAGGGIDDMIDNATLDLCTTQGGDCTCPPGTNTKPTPRRAPQDLRVAATGGLKDGGHAFLQGISKEQWCKGSALNLTVEGEIGGKRYSGLIVGYPAPRLTCDPLNHGNAVHWIGQAFNTHNEIGGEFDMEFGTWTIGDGISDRQISIFGQGSPRVYLGGISGTVTQTPTGGSVDATAATGPDTIHISGTWTCPGPSPAPSP